MPKIGHMIRERGNDLQGLLYKVSASCLKRRQSKKADFRLKLINNRAFLFKARMYSLMSTSLSALITRLSLYCWVIFTLAGQHYNSKAAWALHDVDDEAPGLVEFFRYTLGIDYEFD